MRLARIREKWASRHAPRIGEAAPIVSDDLFVFAWPFLNASIMELNYRWQPHMFLVCSLCQVSRWYHNTGPVVIGSNRR